MSPVAAISGFSVSPTAPVAPLGAGPVQVPGAGAEFGSLMAGLDAASTGSPAAGVPVSAVGRLGDLQRLQAGVDDLAVKAATGQLQDPSQYTIAATEATLATQMTVALRNKAVEAYSEIMRMQL